MEKAFASFMTATSRPTNAAVASAGFNFTEKCSALADIGGGHGTLLGEIVASNPSLSHKATVMDAPGVVDSATPVAGVRFHAGDFVSAGTHPSLYFAAQHPSYPCLASHPPML